MPKANVGPSEIVSCAGAAPVPAIARVAVCGAAPSSWYETESVPGTSPPSWA